jgi:uncharacterized protein YlzI (FlbEa/FlbD family)
MVEEFLKLPDIDARLTNGNKWLVWNSAFNEWVVYSHRLYQRQSTIEYQGEFIYLALKALKGE